MPHSQGYHDRYLYVSNRPGLVAQREIITFFIKGKWTSLSSWSSWSLFYLLFFSILTAKSQFFVHIHFSTDPRLISLSVHVAHPVCLSLLISVYYAISCNCPLHNLYSMLGCHENEQYMHNVYLSTCWLGTTSRIAVFINPLAYNASRYQHKGRPPHEKVIDFQTKAVFSCSRM